VIPADIAAAFKSFKGEIGLEVYPALLSVGYIVGPRIASFMFVGSLVGWMVLIPMICLFGPDTILYPGTDTIANLYAAGGASAIWSTYVKYIGAGAIATGGIISLIKSLPLIFTTFRDSIKSMKGGRNTSTARTAQDLPMSVILAGIVVMIVIIWLVPAIPVNLLGAVLIVVFGFFFATVSSRMVGLIGSSNNPVSGMTIATLLIATIVIKASGDTGITGMTGSIAIGSVICIIAAIAGDTSQDLKTGYLLGATPKKQQIGELIGIIASGLAIGGVLYLLNAAWGYGGAEVPAPQATLMKMIVEGIMGGDLPWALVFIGVFLAIGLEILRIPVMPFAIGLYLPIYMNATIMIGGIVRGLMDSRKNVDEETKERQATDGTLFCAGMIAGEGLIGILLAILAVIGVNMNLSQSVNFGNIGGLVLIALMVLSLLKFSVWKKNKA
jgi:putative OPT family oligopeptide transporter